MYAFDAAGTNGCSGTPRTCTALWNGPVPDPGRSYGTQIVVGGAVSLNGDLGLEVFRPSS